MNLIISSWGFTKRCSKPTKLDVGRKRCARDSVWTLTKDPSRLQLLRSAADQLPSAHLLITNIIIAIIIIAIVSGVLMKYKYETLTNCLVII